MAKRNGAAQEFIVVTLRAFRDEDGFFVSECVELQTASQGESLDDALDMALDATQVYLEGITEYGDRERIFRERGIEPLKEAPEDINLRGTVHSGDTVRVLVLPLPQPANLAV